MTGRRGAAPTGWGLVARTRRERPVRPGRRPPAPVVVLAGAVLVVVTGGCSASEHPERPSGPAASAKAPASAPAAQVLPAAQATRIQTALTAPPGPTVAQALAPAMRAPYLRHPVRLLPPGSTLTVQAGALLVDGDSATVPAVVTGGPAAGHWLLLLVKTDGQWLLYGTRKP